MSRKKNVKKSTILTQREIQRELIKETRDRAYEDRLFCANLITAIPESKGLIKNISKATGYQYDVIYYFLKDPQNESIREYYMAERARVADQVEEVLIEKCLLDKDMKAIQFFLSGIAKDRGYGKENVSKTQLELDRVPANIQVSFNAPVKDKASKVIDIGSK